MIDQLKQQILNISKDLNLSHIGSNLSALPVYIEIYKKKKPDSIVIACNAHSHLAHLVVQRAFSNITVIEPTEEEHIEHIINDFGIHCDRKAGCDASGGSLGHGLGIGIGYALADRKRNVYVIVSDGSTMEGSFWEALRIAKQLNLTNLKIYTNFNSYTAVAQIDLDYWENCIKAFGFPVAFRRTNNGLPELEGIKGHYQTL